MTALVETSPGSREGWEQVLLACRIDVELVRAELIAGTLGAAVLLEGADGWYTADASVENAHTACEIETLAGEGPGTAALEGRTLVWVPDIAMDSRWRVWRRAAQGMWAAVLAVPVSFDRTAGAAIIYATDPEVLEPLRSRLENDTSGTVDGAGQGL